MILAESSKQNDANDKKRIFYISRLRGVFGNDKKNQYCFASI